MKKLPRSRCNYLSVEEAQPRAAELFAQAATTPPGAVRQSVFKEACDYHILAEMKRLVASADKARGGAAR